MDLIVRRLSLEGTSNLTALSEKLKLSYPVVDYLFRSMRQHNLIEVKGMIGNDYWITLSGAGRALAIERGGIAAAKVWGRVERPSVQRGTRYLRCQRMVDERRSRRAIVVPASPSNPPQRSGHPRFRRAVRRAMIDARW